MVIRIITITLIVIACMDNHAAEDSAQRSTSRVPFALILAPTEELCNKLKEMVQHLTIGLTAHLIKVLSVCKPTGPLMLLDGGTDIIIGTPEMVAYLDGHECIDWTYLSFLGLDRVDDLMAPDHKGHMEKLLHPESGTISRGTQVGYTLISTSSKMTPELRSHILQNYTGAQHGHETCELSVESVEVIKTTVY
ncbi:hypothetical protein NpNSSI1_00006984 [Neofusicoccum parvum]|uniref:Uncharacterized protein n=1 Tax=Neofusicoccum parvum TaxID=310453 RepID=A0ACB5RSH8_9PEZI|nr:hypothetical protein NpPPO83_00006245 [Neofusicoccum parvum]GME63499.1 hypothetical protein NpNSSI1_00006984 [Neofusicoccum parvum]